MNVSEAIGRSLPRADVDFRTQRVRQIDSVDIETRARNESKPSSARSKPM